MTQKWGLFFEFFKLLLTIAGRVDWGLKFAVPETPYLAKRCKFAIYFYSKR
jgi:hypothetical protein